MKTITKMFMLMSFTLFATASCNDATEENIENTADTIGSKVESGYTDIKEDIDDYMDETFVENVLEENGEALYLLKLAATKGRADYVRNAAAKMEREHRDMQDKFMAYARQHNVNMDDNDYSDNLETKDMGQDWDDEWNRELTNKHQKLINKFERKADNADDPELQRLANTYLPALRQHLSTLEQNK